MVVLLRASRARPRVPARPRPPAALGPAGREFSRKAAPGGRLLALLAGLLAAADYLDFICSGAWLVAGAAELVTGAAALARPRLRPPAG